MTILESALQNFEAYPRWFVALCAIILGIIAVWVLTKLLKWTLYLAAFVVLGCFVVFVMLWWLG